MLADFSWVGATLLWKGQGVAPLDLGKQWVWEGRADSFAVRKRGGSRAVPRKHPGSAA